MNPVTINDIEWRWRPLTQPEQIVASTLLEDAWAELLARVPQIEQRIDSGALSPALVTRVITAMVLRVLKNTEGKFQEQIDDYSYSRERQAAAGYLFLSEDEMVLLSPRARGGAFTIVPG